MNKIARIVSAILLAIMSAPAALAATPADEATIAKIMTPTIELLRAGKSRQAVDTFFTGSPIAAGKNSEIQMLANQVDNTVGAYGPFGECRLTEQRTIGEFVVQMLYHCQHTHYVTRWTFVLVKTTKGWQGATFDFDDKVTVGLAD